MPAAGTSLLLHARAGSDIAAPTTSTIQDTITGKTQCFRHLETKCAGGADGTTDCA